ncbi:uncharacterized protein (DUF924 family) [Tahibacter aquaticus]|uniref:Uncharacterized protein (DUF924 family) n=2 Tax=Tahibacter aquaticus TaxID=520092 RepID=A0A4R6YN09_9GAMM|nr:uncharacterized protein (DUF924 family) [Tahibacter aquaticus]
MTETILEFWFGADNLESEEQARLAQRWFSGDAQFDAEIRRRFGSLVDAALAGELSAWSAQPRSWLALLLLLDQFPRNLYRGSAQAFAGDHRAQATALAGIARGDDLALPARYRAFAYLPLEHAEEIVLQRHSVDLFRRLAADPEAQPAEQFLMYVEYAKAHHDVIARFGRFPHRNAVLGRAVTAEEQVYLDQGGGF